MSVERWARYGSKEAIKIAFGVPYPQKTKGDVAAAAEVTTNREAVTAEDVVVLSVPWPAAHQAIQDAGQLDNKVLIDCTNPLAPDLKGLAVGLTTSAGDGRKLGAESQSGKGLQHHRRAQFWQRAV